MKKNEGQTDRIIRIVVGVALIALGLFVNWTGVLPWLILVLGVILLVTGIIGFCPLYALLKINTLKK